MKVRELIQKLLEFDQELEVVVDGYEGGVKTPRMISQSEIAVDYHKGMTYYGPHEIVDNFYYVGYEGEEKYEIKKVVYIKR